MSNLKKDIEELVDEHADAVLEARDETNQSRAVDLQDKADLDFTLKIISLIEKAEQKLLAEMTLDSKTVDYQGEQWNAILVKKLKNITLEQDEDIPNGAWDTNIHNNMKQILANLYSQAYADGVVGHSRNDDILTAHKEIINLIEAVIPEEIDVKSKYETGDDGGINVTVDENNDTLTGDNLVHLAKMASDNGYNQAIKDIKNKLII